MVLPTKEMQFVEASRVIGCGDARFCARAILPSCVPAFIVLFSFSVANAILYESGLSFLGLGAQPPQPSWGTMLSSAKSYMFDDPWYTLVVGVTLSATIIGLNLVGDAIREVIDPLLARRRLKAWQDCRWTLLGTDARAIGQHDGEELVENHRRAGHHLAAAGRWTCPRRTAARTRC